MIAAHAPLSLEILGNHTDYNEGIALGAALQFGVTVEGELREGREVILHHEGTKQTEKFTIELAQKHHENPWANPAKGVVLELLKHQIPLGGFEATIRSNLPPIFDVNSGSMLAVAIAVFLQRAFPFEAASGVLASLCRDAESQAGNPYSGLFSPLTSLSAVAGSLVQLDYRSLEAKPILFPNTLKFVVCDTGTKNLLVHSKIKLRYDQCKEALRVARNNAPEITTLRDINPIEMQKIAGQMNQYVFRTAMHVCTENQRVRESVEELERGGTTALAANMNLSQLSSTQSIENSTDLINTLVEIAKELPGFAAARLSGYGFGGLTIHLVAADQAEAYRDAIVAAFTPVAGKKPEAFVAELSAGALAS
jgi:galactokinase